MDILFFIPTGGGGAEKVSLTFAKILKRSGKTIHVVFIEDGNKNVMKYISPDISYEIISVPSHIARYIAILKCIRKYKPLVVFSSLTALSSVLILSKFFYPKIKVVTRQCFTPKHGSKLINVIIRILFRYADINIAQTKEMRDQMIKVYGLLPTKVLVIHNPLDIQDIKSKIIGIERLRINKHRFIAIGRIDPAKDYPTLIKAFCIVKNKLPDASLKIFGHASDPNLLNEITKLIETKALKESVLVNSYTDNPYRELLESNCFVLSSITEGLPNVLLEAMYLNVPCAATRSIPFISHVIENGKNGYTAEVGNVYDVAEAMIGAVSLFGTVKNTNSEGNNYSLIINTFSI